MLQIDTKTKKGQRSHVTNSRKNDAPQDFSFIFLHFSILYVLGSTCFMEMSLLLQYVNESSRGTNIMKHYCVTHEVW